MPVEKISNELIRKIVNLNIKQANEKTKLDIEYLMIKIKKYESLINVLKTNKPLFFERKKLIEYNNRLSEYDSKINELYDEIGKELNLYHKIELINDE